MAKIIERDIIMARPINKFSSVVVRPRNELVSLAVAHLGWELVIDRRHFGFYPSQDAAEMAAMIATGLKPCLR